MKFFAKIIMFSSLILPMNLWAAPYGGMGEIVVFGILLLGFVVFILFPYISFRLIWWIGYLSKLIFNKEERKFESGWISMDILLCIIGFSLYDKYMLEPERKRMQWKQAEPFSKIILSKEQIVAGMIMPAGTKLETNVDIHRTQPEPDKFIHARFSKPILWNGISIVYLYRSISSLDKNAPIWSGTGVYDNTIKTRSNQSTSVGKLRCGTELRWGFISSVPYNQSAEPYVYLEGCDLTGDNQVALLPEFNTKLPIYKIRRKHEKYRDVNKGLWWVNIVGNEKALAKATKVLNLSIDSNLFTHEFVAELEDDPAHNCGMPKHTLFAWKKTQPNVIQVVTPEPHAIPEKCWEKKLVPTSFEQMSNEFKQQHSEFFHSREYYFKNNKKAYY